MGNVLRGTVRKGLGCASQTLPLQFPYFLSSIPELDKFHQGTINVELDKDFICPKPDYSFQHVCWTPGFYESFDFIKAHIVLNSKPDKKYQAFIYRPSKSKNISNSKLVEIISPMISDLHVGVEVHIYLLKTQ